jgi:hypothetical protein
MLKLTFLIAKRKSRATTEVARLGGNLSKLECTSEFVIVPVHAHGFRPVHLPSILQASLLSDQKLTVTENSN